MATSRGRATKYQVLNVAKLPFLDELSNACAACDRAQALPPEHRNVQVEDAFFRAAVALETFLSEWLVRCLSFDARSLQQRAETELDGWIDDQIRTLGGLKGGRFEAYRAGQTKSLSIP